MMNPRDRVMEASPARSGHGHVAKIEGDLNRCPGGGIVAGLDGGTGALGGLYGQRCATGLAVAHAGGAEVEALAELALGVEEIDLAPGRGRRAERGSGIMQVVDRLVPRG